MLQFRKRIWLFAFPKGDNMDLKEKILDAAIEEFQEKGLKLTMDDIAKHLKVSKKTIYSEYRSKDEVLMALADYSFREIKKGEREILANENLSIIEKIRDIVIVLPKRYQNLDLKKLYQLSDKYPKVYKKVANYLETDWDATIYLLEKGIRLGVLRPISIPIFKAMVESTIQHFFRSNILVENNIDYNAALKEMIDILLEGIRI